MKLKKILFTLIAAAFLIGSGKSASYAACANIPFTAATSSLADWGKSKLKDATDYNTEATTDNDDITAFLDPSSGGNYNQLSRFGLRTAVKAACESKCNRNTCGSSSTYKWCTTNCGGGNGKLIPTCTAIYNVKNGS